MTRFKALGQARVVTRVVLTTVKVLCLDFIHKGWPRECPMSWHGASRCRGVMQHHLSRSNHILTHTFVPGICSFVSVYFFFRSKPDGLDAQNAFTLRDGLASLTLRGILFTWNYSSGITQTEYQKDKKMYEWIAPLQGFLLV